ncbi:hypothetical protein HYQ46_000318 [Verticillium longisporum]|nr:hypothetical protein HYQ46_000318 [Verticillium longisporum]
MGTLVRMPHILRPVLSWNIGGGTRSTDDGRGQFAAQPSGLQTCHLVASQLQHVICSRSGHHPNNVGSSQARRERPCIMSPSWQAAYISSPLPTLFVLRLRGPQAGPDEFTIASEDMIVAVRRGFDLKGRVMQCRYGMHGGCSLQH